VNENNMEQGNTAAGLRAALERIREALEDGDASFAYAIAESALELPASRPHVCEVCSVGFRWVGELDHHRRFAHDLEDLEAAA